MHEPSPPTSGFLHRFLSNHVLANLLFALVLIVGTLSYMMLPRQQDPSINFNWIDITTLFPGASASDVEKRVTDVLEDAIVNISDIKFVSSNSREGVSNVLIRFYDMDALTFDKRVADLRREIANKESELPDDIIDPVIVEVTAANAFPTATIVVTGRDFDENLRREAVRIRDDLQRIKGVDSVLQTGLSDPEIQINFKPERLLDLGITPVDIADTVTAYYRDLSAGSVSVDGESWLVRVEGTDNKPERLAELPILTASGEVTLGNVADIVRGREKVRRLVSFNDQPAVMFAITKKGDANILELVTRINDYLAQRNALGESTGVQLTLIDDQTQITRDALNVMQTNSLFGLLFVLLVTWAFLGGRIALLTCIGIPFILAGTFWILRGLDQTLNVTVLLGVVISLGMLVDDAVVVVEAIFYRLQRGINAMQASIAAIKEVFAPVTTSVLTTMAAFLPLMLLPGILGKFMLIVPLVVTIALAVSLIEAFWMLPAHVIAANVNFDKPSRFHVYRTRVLERIRTLYTGLLMRVLKHPIVTLISAALMTGLAIAAMFVGVVKFDFFASDPIRLFYVNVEMHPGTTLRNTLTKVVEVERRVKQRLRPEEVRSVVSYSGQMFTELVVLVGDRYGQIIVSLNPKAPDGRDVDAIMDAMREDVQSTPGAAKISFLRIAGGPPTSKPISVKVRGETFEDIRSAVVDIENILRSNDHFRDITNNESPGPMELSLRVDQDAARRAKLDPRIISRTVRLMVDGEEVATMQDAGEEVGFRVRAAPQEYESIDRLLDYVIAKPSGENLPLSSLVTHSIAPGLADIRHYNFRRAATVEADIDKTQTDTVAANAYLVEEWEKIQSRHPNINLDFSGELDDIQESLSAISVLFLIGLGLIYLILGTQFRSYFQPLLVLASVPMAGIGVVLGLIVSQNPLSLFTLYGVVALAGIAVNSAIVMISTANTYLAQGRTVYRATLMAARRRVIPILITSLTTIAGLFSLATGLGGESLLWGPIATSIVWGLGFSTLLTLFVTPLLYKLFMSITHRQAKFGG